MSPYTPRTSPLDNKHLADNIDIQKISSKGFFHEGSSFTKPKAKGLQGQLGKMRREHKFSSAKNLSRRNLKDISDLIAKEMKNAHPYSKAGLTRKMGKRIMATAWKKVKTDPTFTRSDRKDLKVVVKAIKEKSRAAVLKKPDASTKSIGSEKIEALKNPASRLPNQTTNNDVNPKISSDSLLNSILTKNISTATPFDRKTTLIKLKRSEPAENNNSQTPTNQPSNSTPAKNNPVKQSTDPFLNSLLSKTTDSVTAPKNNEDNNEGVEPKAKTVINKPAKPTEDKAIQTTNDNPENPVTDEPSDTESKSTKDESSEPTKKTSAELAKEEALRKKRNIASAGALTRMLNEEAKKNNPNNQKTSSDPENSTGDKSAKPTTEPIISGSAKPRKTDDEQSTTEQFLDVDSIDYLTELAKKLAETKQAPKPIISQKTAGISEIAEKAEDMSI